MNKILVYGGLIVTGLGIFEIILFLFAGILSHQLDNIPKTKINEIIFLWWIGSVLMIYMGNKFLDKGLNERQSNRTDKQ